MELTAEIKLLGDGYAGGFSCGMSTSASDTARGFNWIIPLLILSLDACASAVISTIWQTGSGIL
ncbi:hypothetical protein [Butyrivibrio sp. MC2021]|uniref:hypothetical protein n=1 Tax=Butyrivibrio sp. MC2021 TaxID=1408306 RepID=UPI0012DC0BC6|nr:hypothetical protein [Butyrivibrio sp. MC2021]